MNNKDSAVVIGAIGNDQDTSYQAREQALNATILQADISENFEQYLAICNTFYADDIQVSSKPQNSPSGEGKSAIRSRRVSGPASPNGGDWWPSGICPRESYRWCGQ